MIAGLELPSEGRILIAGRDVTDARRDRARRQHGVPVLRAVPAHERAGERLPTGCAARAVAKDDAEKRAREGLAQVGPRGYGERQPSELSGGQQQRVAVARALVLKPSVLLFDEPLSNLDARLRRQMREEIRELQQRLGLTVVYVTHDQQEAMAVSDRIIVMNAGRIEQQGTPRDLYERPATPFLARFMGESNPARGHVRRLDAGRVRVHAGAMPRSRSTTRPRATARPPSRCGPKRSRSRRRRVRPVRCRARSRKASYLGTHMEYSIDTAAGTLFATCPRSSGRSRPATRSRWSWRRAA